jgi:hypothetical protein
MNRAPIIKETEIRQVADRLGITPKYFFDGEGNFASGAASTVDTFNPNLIRPSGMPWFLTPLWRINLKTFHGKLQDYFNDLHRRFGIGYCYMIFRNGSSVHSGAADWAQLPDDPEPEAGGIHWRHSVPMNVGSVSKFVTAIAVVRLLLEKNIRSTRPVYDFLPKYWRPHFTLNSISFDKLLGHRSGLGRALNPNNMLNSNSGPGDFAAAKTYVFTGGPQDDQFDYKNLSYAVLRVLFATLTETLPSDFNGASSTDPTGDLFWDVASAGAYCGYVNDNVFAPADIAPRGFTPDGDAAKAYSTPPEVPGARLFSGYTGIGPGGWHLSIGELVRLLDAFRSGSILPRWRAEQLLYNLYGLDQAIATRAGTVYTKGGRELDGEGRGMDSAIYLMPGNVSFAIFVNSLGRPAAVSRPGNRAPPPLSHLRDIPQLIEQSIEFIF